MSVKFVWIGLTVGSMIGSYIPVLWGDNPFSLSAIIFSGIGGAIGLWLGYRVDQSI